MQHDLIWDAIYALKGRCIVYSRAMSRPRFDGNRPHDPIQRLSFWRRTPINCGHGTKLKGPKPSKILDKYQRTTSSFDALMPELYLPGLSTNDFKLGLRSIFGEGLNPCCTRPIPPYPFFKGDDASAWCCAIWKRALRDVSFLPCFELYDVTPRSKKIAEKSSISNLRAVTYL